jgi:hypothetical protein
MQRSNGLGVFWAFAAAAALSVACGDDGAVAAASAGAAAPPSAANGQASADNSAAITAGSPATQSGLAGRAGTATPGGTAGKLATSAAGAGAAGASQPASAGSGGAVAQAAAAGASAGNAGVGAPAAGSSAAAGTSAPSGTPVLTTQTLIPHKSWDCGMPEGIPDPKAGEPVFEATLTVAEVHDIGDTQYGHRLQIDISGGTLTGPKIKADFMKRGLDYELTLSNGALEDEQINILKTSDGAYIYFRTCGASPGPGSQVRVTFDFEAPTTGSYAFLNTGKFVGIREFDPVAKTLKLSAFQATDAPDMTGAITVVEPDGVPDQTWECKQYSGTTGKTIYTESVGIGDGQIAVGASKRGTRNIVPITGGTTKGMLEGMVFDGGADYQLIGDELVLDARYTAKSSDGEVIIIRNCGPVGGLVPVFETRTTGKYAWLNANTWLSSNPSVGAGVVNLTIYEQK